MKAKKLGLLFGGVLVLFALLYIWCALLGRERLFLILRYWEKSAPIEFYGRVVDQQNHPLVGANVSVMVEVFNASALAGSREYMSTVQVSVVTNADGNFMFKSRGMGVYITDVSCNGYVAIPERNWDNQTHVAFFGYERERGVPYYVPDPMNPSVFPLRKENESRTKWPSRGGKDEPNTWK